MPRPPGKSGTARKKIIWGSLSIILILGASFGIYYAFNPLSITGGDSTTVSASTFKIISYTDGEDVSNFVEISIWIPDSDKTIDDTGDIYTLSKYEEDVKSKDAEDVSIDLSTYSYIWIEIDPDASSVFSTTWVLYTNPTNRLYTLYAYHLSSDVNFNILNVTTMDEWDKAADGNYTVNLDFPHYTTANSHSGNDGWAIDAEEKADMSASELEELYDERNYRCQAPLYVPSDDDEKDFVDDLEKLTEAFALKFTMNTTISQVDANVKQVNFTITDRNLEVDLVISGELIYLIFTEVIEAPLSFTFEIQMAANITCSNIHSGRIAVPQDSSNLGTFTALSAIAA